MRHVNFGWKALQKALNTIIDAYNRQRIIPGDGISVKYTESGTIISVTASRDDSDASNTGTSQTE